MFIDLDFLVVTAAVVVEFSTSVCCQLATVSSGAINAAMVATAVLVLPVLEMAATVVAAAEFLMREN